MIPFLGDSLEGKGQFMTFFGDDVEGFLHFLEVGAVCHVDVVAFYARLRDIGWFELSSSGARASLYAGRQLRALMTRRSFRYRSGAFHSALQCYAGRWPSLTGS
jgi:hypothetical protein